MSEDSYGPGDVDYIHYYFDDGQFDDEYDQEWYDDPAYDTWYTEPTRWRRFLYWITGLWIEARYRIDPEYRKRLDDLPF